MTLMSCFKGPGVMYYADEGHITVQTFFIILVVIFALTTKLWHTLCNNYIKRESELFS